MEDAGRAVIVLPAEHLGVELAGCDRIVGRQVDEDQGVGLGHGHRLLDFQEAYSSRLGVNTSRLSTASSPTTSPQWVAPGGTTSSPPGPTRVTPSPMRKSMRPSRI